MFVGTNQEKGFYIGTYNGIMFYNSVLLDTDTLYGTTVYPQGFRLEDWTYSIENEQIVLSKYKNNTSKYSFIPSQFDGTDVIINMVNAYSGITGLVDIKAVEDYVVTVNSMYNTYNGCKNLVNIPSIPKNITNLHSAFINTKIKNVSLPNSVRVLTNAFMHSAIESIDIPDSVTTMESAFYNCTHLTTVYSLSDNVMSLNSAFAKSNIRNIPNIPFGTVYLTSTFSNCRYLTQAPEIPETVTSLVETFSNCTNLSIMTALPNSIKSLVSTFKNCVNLISAPIIPSSVVNMYGSFDGCKNMQGVIDIKGNISNMISTFNNTSLSKYVYYSDKSSYSNAVSYWNGKNGVTIYDVELFSPNMFNDVTYHDNTITLGHFNSNAAVLVIPSIYNNYNVELSGAYCFTNSNLRSVTIERGVSVNNTNVYAMFYNSKNLQTVSYLPDNIEYMDYCYGGCDNLVSAYIPSNAISIGRSFYRCISLIDPPSIPSKVVNMTDTFWHCHNLKSMPELPEGVQDLSGAFASCYNLVNIKNIPSSVTNMRGTFQDSNRFNKMTEIPERVTNMHTTFYGSTNLGGNINIRSNNISDFTDCFYGTSVTKYVYTYKNSETDKLLLEKYPTSRNGVYHRYF